MAYVSRHRINATVTATGGAAQSFYSPSVLQGHIEAIRYQPATASGISTAAHISITGEQSGIEVLTATATGIVTWYPRAGAMNTSAVALGYSSGAAPPMVPALIPVANERLKVTFTSGGTASAGGLRGTLDLYLSGQ